MKKLLLLILTLSVTLSFGQKENTFNFVIETTEEKTEYMFSVDDAVDIEVDWGNGSSDTYNGTDTPTHDFGEAGLWTIKVNGQASRIRFYTGWNCKYAEMLRDILTPVSDGITGITSTRYMFRGTTVESFAAADFFDNASANVTDMRWMFQDSNFNQDIGGWDVSNVTDMTGLFRGTPFNKDIGNWDVSNVTFMNGMFRFSEFNQDIGEWDVSNVTNMGSMFSGAEDFNHDLSSWDVSNVTNMSNMFRSTDFNQDIDGWDVSNVTTMRYMFAYSQFNSSIASWDVSSVTNTLFMFGYSAFNQDIGEWDVSNVTTMKSMFSHTDFNHDIGAWDVSSVTNMSFMLGFIPFNYDIGGWDVSSVTHMRGMFYNSAFNQDISNWDVSNVENFDSFLELSELSTENYNKLLIKWAKLDLQQDINFDGGSSKYDLGLPEDRRQHIIDEFGWTFTDGGDTGNEVFLLTLYANPQDAGEVEGEGLYYADDNVDVKAMANLGYELISWTDGNEEEVNTEPEFVFVMPAETVSLTANFALVDYELTVNIYPEGAGSISGEGSYNMDDEVTLEATANEGYEFISWTDGEEVVSENAVYVITMPANHINLSANFSVITSISEEPSFGHSISIFPNPTRKHIYIEGVKKNSSIEVISITGTKMMQRGNQSGKVYLDVSRLDNGIYIIKISSEKGIVSRKIFVNK